MLTTYLSSINLPSKQKRLRSVSLPSDLRISTTERNGPAPAGTAINKEKTDTQIAQYVTRITPPARIWIRIANKEGKERLNCAPKVSYYPSIDLFKRWGFQ